MIKRSIPWTSQPQYPVPPNNALLGSPPIHLLNFGVGLVGLGERKTYTPTAITYAAGSAIFNGSTACITAETSALGIANGFALVCRFKVNTIGATQCLFVKDYSADGDRCLQFRVDAAGALNFIRFDAAKSVITNITGGTVTAGKWHTAVPFYSGTGSGIYLDGKLVASDSVTTANNDVSASTPLLIGCGYSSTTHANTLFLGGSISVAAVLKKIPTELCRGISGNIWQIFAPQQRNIYVSVAGGSPTVVTLDPATFGFAPQNTQNTLGASLITSALNFTAQDVQNNAINNLNAVAFDFVAHDIAAENASTATVTLDTATFDFVANDNQNALYAELTAAAFDFVANGAQPLIAHSLDVCAFDFAGRDTQNRLGLLLENAIFDFVTRSITAGDPLAPTTGRATNMMLMGVGN